MARVIDPASQDEGETSDKAQTRPMKHQSEKEQHEDEQVQLISQAFQQSMTQVEEKRGKHMRIPRLPVGFSANNFQGEQFAFVGSFNDQPLKTAKMMVELVGGQVVALDMHPTRIITGRDIPKNISDKINKTISSHQGVLSHSLRDFMLLFFELSRSSRAAKPTIEPAVKLASNDVISRADKSSPTPVASRDPTPERVSSMPRDTSSRDSSPVPERSSDLPKPVFYDKQYQPWDLYIDEAIPESIRDRLTQQISTNGGRLVPASQADIILFDPHHPTHPLGPTTADGNPGANLRPWHWVFFCLQERKLLKTSLMESQVPVFVKKRNLTEPHGDQGGMLACWLAEKVPNRSKLEKMLLSYGGLITRRRQNAIIFIVDPGSTDKETLDIIHVYSHDRSRYVLSYDWVKTCVELGEIARLPTDQSSNAPVPDGRSNHRFTADDDRHLVQYIARELFDQERLPRKGQRLGDRGNKIYQLLVSESYKPEVPRPWALNHPWESWRTRYKNQAHLGMERAVQEAVRRLQQKLPLKSSPSPPISHRFPSPSASSSIQFRPERGRVNMLRKGKGRALEDFYEPDDSDLHDDDDDYQDREEDQSEQSDEGYIPPSIRPRKTISEMMAPFRPSRQVQRPRSAAAAQPPLPPTTSELLSEDTEKHKTKHPPATPQHRSLSTTQPTTTILDEPESLPNTVDSERDESEQIQARIELADEAYIEGSLAGPNPEFDADLKPELGSASEDPGESTQRVKILMDNFLEGPTSVATDMLEGSQGPLVPSWAKRKREDSDSADEEEEEGPESYRLRLLLDDHLRSQTQISTQRQDQSPAPDETGWE